MTRANRDRCRWTLLGVGLSAVLLAGCTSTSRGPAPATPGSTRAPVPVASTVLISSTVPIASATPLTSPGPAGTSVSRPPAGTTDGRPPVVTATVTRTREGQTITSTIGPPTATPTPAAVTGDCPYLSADVVSEITGQHHGPTQLIGFSPEPMCLFYRSDGGLMGSVRIVRATTPQGAVAAVNQHVPIADSQPASQPAGWSGGSITTPGQMTQDSSASSVYAVSKGKIAVVAQENESPSIKARVMAVCAIYGLKLQAGPAPDYCTAQG